MTNETPINWFWDCVSPTYIQQFSVSAMPYTGKSKFQSIQVLDTPSFGRCLILDGKIQCSESDEFIYHEALVHPAMIAHPRPETVFIAGGGEGATLREVLAHKTVKRVVMVDIDKKVPEICRKYLPSLSEGAFKDKRLELLHMDALKYIDETKDKFDVMVIDLTEPLEEGPAYLLFTKEFYRDLDKKLKKGGLMSLQAGTTALVTPSTFLAVINTLSKVFRMVAPYQVEVPSFGGPWGFAVVSQGLDPRQLSEPEIDRRIAKRIVRPLRMYDGAAHPGLFSLPRYLRQQLAEEKTVITRDKPFFTY
jgi:spermidine synthase